MAYNAAHGIVPKQIRKDRKMADLIGAHGEGQNYKAYVEPEQLMAADPIVEVMSVEQLKKSIDRTRRQMQEAAKRLEFMEAASYRDEMLRLMALLEEREPQ